MTVPTLADMVEDVNSAPTLAKLRITTISYWLCWVSKMR